MSNQKNSVPFLSLDYGEVNPNHKLKLLALVPPKNYWITNVAFRFRQEDQSIYLAPQLTSSFTIEGLDMHGTRYSFRSLPSGDIHLSFHETGIINLTIGKHNARLRSIYKRATFEVVTLGIKDPLNLKVATDPEINTLPQRYKVVVVPGFFIVSPVFITIFRVPTSEKWKMPLLSRVLQSHVGFKLANTETRYEIIVWQNPNIPDFPGDIALSFGS